MPKHEFTAAELKIAAEVTDVLEGRHRKWLEDFASNHDISYEDLMNGAADWIATEERTYLGVDIDYDAFPEFWDHYEALTTEKVDKDKRHNFFRCAC